MRYGIRMITLGACAALCLQALALTREQAQQAIDIFAGDSMLRHASVSVAVSDVATDSIVAGHNEQMSCITASTMKTLTTSSALQLLGPDFKFHTRVMMHGEVDGNTLRGDLVVIGGGDPTLGSAYFREQPNIVKEVVDSLTSRGIKKINGKIVVNDSIYPYPDHNGWWQDDDLATDYGMGLHGLNYCDNRVTLRFRVTDGYLDKVTLDPDVPGLEVLDRLNPGRKDDIALRLEPSRPAIVVTGTASPTKSYKEVVTNPVPAVLLTDSLTRALQTADIKLRNRDRAVHFDDDVPDTLTLLVDHTSPRLAKIMQSLLERSDNMYTEGLLRAMAVRSGRAGTFADGVQVVDSLWRAQGLATDALFQYDGSGLARANKASARFFTSMLDNMAARKFSGWRLCDLMPRIGVNARIGSLLQGSNLAGRLAVKSGSMTDVQCYVGYFPAQEPRYAFAVLVNNWNGSRRTLQNRIDQLLIRLFAGEK